MKTATTGSGVPSRSLWMCRSWIVGTSKSEEGTLKVKSGLRHTLRSYTAKRKTHLLYITVKMLILLDSLASSNLCEAKLIGLTAEISEMTEILVALQGIWKKFDLVGEDQS